MEKNTGLWIIGILVACSLVLSAFSLGSIGKVDSGVSEAEMTTAIAAALANQEYGGPTVEEIASETVKLIVIPDVESADNFMLNEWLKSEFADEYDEIELAAEAAAEEELEDHDYRMVWKHMETLFEGLDEDSMDVDVEEVDVEVTRLGLEEDEDKCATVTYELEVEYEFEEGVRDDYEKDLVVVYDVCFDEGDFGDEEVELVSIM